MLDIPEMSVSAMLVGECVAERERPSNEVCRVFKDRVIDSLDGQLVDWRVYQHHGFVGSFRGRRSTAKFGPTAKKTKSRDFPASKPARYSHSSQLRIVLVHKFSSPVVFRFLLFSTQVALILPSSVKARSTMSSQDPFTDKKRIASAEAKIAARKRFEEVFPLLVDELTTYLRSIKLPENAIEWYKGVPSLHFLGLSG